MSFVTKHDYKSSVLSAKNDAPSQTALHVQYSRLTPPQFAITTTNNTALVTRATVQYV